MSTVQRTLLSAAGWLCMTAPLAAQTICWQTDYVQARRDAAAQGKPLLVDFGAANCIWCKRLDATTFRDPAIVALLRDRFIALKIDGDRDAALAAALNINSYPTLIVAAPDGKILGVQQGYLEAARLLPQLQQLASSVSTAPAPEVAGRTLRARTLLAQAKEDFRAQQFLCCLDRCDVLASGYADLSESAEARQLAAEIRNNPEWLKQACESQADRLAALYFSMVDVCLRNGERQQATVYLERVLQAFPKSRHAELAQTRLSQLQGQTATSTGFKK